ncbi:MAG: hypothetical protein VYA51_10450 [Planctomycetota bacterium]|nr:hypothetical protein [Planctomycetota bacterium]MEC9048423.1 hypothetical protein [Planctomycetota bacterium]
MGQRLYVGNLPYDADEAAIRAAFTENGGTVERVHIPLDRETQRPRGFAFVEMATAEEAAQAIAAMDGASFGARTLRVSEAAERRPAGGGGARASDAPHDSGSRDRRPRVDGDMPGRGGPDSGDRGASERARENRERRFGPDARPTRERNRGRKGRGGHGRRRHEDAGDDRGRRGGSRFDDYDD